MLHQIQATDAPFDLPVYDLYGLTEDEIRVVGAGRERDKDE